MALRRNARQTGNETIMWVENVERLEIGPSIRVIVTYNNDRLDLNPKLTTTSGLSILFRNFRHLSHGYSVHMIGQTSPLKASYTQNPEARGQMKQQHGATDLSVLAWRHLVAGLCCGRQISSRHVGKPESHSLESGDHHFLLMWSSGNLIWATQPAAVKWHVLGGTDRFWPTPPDCTGEWARNGF